MHKAEILHERSVVMHQKPRRGDRGIEMLMPAKNGNTPDIVFAPIKAAIFDETVPLPERTSFTSSYMCRCARALPGPERIFCPADVDVEDARMVIGSVQHPAPQHSRGEYYPRHTTKHR